MTDNDFPIDCTMSLDSQQHYDDDNMMMISEDDMMCSNRNRWAKKLHLDLNSLQVNGILSLFVNYSYLSQTYSQMHNKSHTVLLFSVHFIPQ